MPHHFVVGTALSQKKLAADRLPKQPLHLQQVSRFQDLTLPIGNDVLGITNADMSDVQTQINRLDHNTGDIQTR